MNTLFGFKATQDNTVGRKKLNENRMALILEISRGLFATQGYEHTTIEDIANAAGISKASIYLDFKNKHDVLMAVIQQFADEQFMNMQIFLQQPVVSYLQTLHQMLCVHFNQIVHHAIIYKHAPKKTPVIDPEPFALNIAKYRPELLENFIELVTEMLQKAAENGEILFQRDFEHAARLIFMTMLRNATPPHPPHLTPPMIEGMIADVLWMLLISLRTHTNYNNRV